MVEFVKVIDKLLRANLGGLGATVYSVIAPLVPGEQGLDLRLLVALLL